METPQGISILPARRRHIDGIVKCHVAAFPGEFMTNLGPRFLACFYKYYIDHRDGIVLVAVDENNDEIVGLVAGGKPELRRRFTRRRMPLFAGSIIARAIANGQVRRRLREHFGQIVKKIAVKLHVAPTQVRKTQPQEDPKGSWSSLLSICTRPDYRSKGIAKMLMEGFRTQSEHRGYKTMRLSVHNDNKAAIALYKKCGWEPILTVPSGTYLKRKVRRD